MIQFQGGRLPPDPSKPRLKLARYLAAAPAPQGIDYLSKVKSWPMYLNDEIGDCTCAGAGHILQAESAYGQGTTVTIGDKAVLTAYETVSGYSPDIPKSDQGARMQDVLSYWRKTGFEGHKILAFAHVDESDGTQLNTALKTFGSLYVGFKFPDSAMTQFNNGEPWDVVPGPAPKEGHAIHVGYYGPDEPAPWKLITWAKVQAMTQRFWDTYVDEAWIVITPEWFDANGKNPEGLDLHALGEDFAALTGEPNPFPAPAPGPEPAPTPVDVADQALALTAHEWLATNPWYYHDVQAAMRTWLTAKGLDAETPTTEGDPK